MDVRCEGKGDGNRARTMGKGKEKRKREGGGARAAPTKVLSVETIALIKILGRCTAARSIPKEILGRIPRDDDESQELRRFHEISHSRRAFYSLSLFLSLAVFFFSLLHRAIKDVL